MLKVSKLQRLSLIWTDLYNDFIVFEILWIILDNEIRIIWNLWALLECLWFQRFFMLLKIADFSAFRDFSRLIKSSSEKGHAQWA